ncbi:unnamed protein product [Chironomus riparius]|uniref:Uncharacterized protein n=1 Tax=Chironomus riparius TaxID=315576 RepID=A0A9N9RUV1_9DIPT|nr:unnamed protein product [Chironomus riparius]
MSSSAAQIYYSDKYEDEEYEYRWSCYAAKRPSSFGSKKSSDVGE